MSTESIDLKKILEENVVPTSLAVLLKEISHLRTEMKSLLTNPKGQNMKESNLVDQKDDSRYQSEEGVK